MGRKVGGVSVMKDKEIKLKEIEGSHTRWSGGRSCPREREVKSGECVDVTLVTSVKYCNTIKNV